MSSTPISKLPVHHPNLQISGDSQEDDPEVQAVLQEVQQAHQPPPMVQTQMYQLPPRMSSPPQMAPTQVNPSNTSSWFQHDLAKKAIFAAILAGILFHPKSLTLLYEKVPMLNRFESYDLFIRIALLAVVLYGLMWKLHL